VERASGSSGVGSIALLASGFDWSWDFADNESPQFDLVTRVVDVDADPELS